MNYAMQAIGLYKESEQASALKQRDHKDATDLILKLGGGDQLDSNNSNAIVRRLTPVECARLQGFPDDWCEIGDWTDENGKMHKDSDSAKYKALGNAIALPYWQVLLKRISAQYERPATMGSLFSGIGGFDLCWIRCNGTKSVLWESEIESFPIAVCKKHFGDEDAGIEGDVRNYL